MNKKLLITGGILLVAIPILLLWFKSYTKSHSPEAVALYHQNGLEIHINYCQPYKKGRTIFGDAATSPLQPYGAYWRLGANEATTFENNKDITINGKPLKAGKYQVYTVPGKDSWKVCFNTEWDRWGATEANHETDVLVTEVPANNHAPAMEQLQIGFDTPDSTGTCNMLIHWDKTQVKVPLLLATN